MRRSSGTVALHRLLNAGKETALTALAVAGCLSLLAVAAGAWLGVSLIVFRTGSMSPGIEPGAVAVVREVPATSLQPGDIATVQREESALPVTHRVVASEADPANAQKVLLTLKGDANTTEDPVRYHVESAKKLIFAVPELGSWVMRLQSPWLMGFTTVAMAALVTVTFWPRKGARPETPGRDSSKEGVPVQQIPKEQAPYDSA
ncbi:signal peptidase I [Pseudarthrobacter sp. NamB4]|uniref:signal peptidase I n=1 Tax=Pseudarthrobacter sp. NamB4 TaxID=2576837 RepID=UPI0010FEBC90|nr:signal peptidase I [Pseudarthrobacter sp. NamB4]TLM70917.1 signal peptidase I [Pseudarthrobacter sp. NamB4]